MMKTNRSCEQCCHFVRYSDACAYCTELGMSLYALSGCDHFGEKEVSVDEEMARLSDARA